MVPSKGFKSERGGGSRVERLGRIAMRCDCWKEVMRTSRIGKSSSDDRYLGALRSRDGSSRVSPIRSS